jgi:hypothetical protein
MNILKAYIFITLGMFIGMGVYSWIEFLSK